MLVVNDAPLAEAIERLRGEWAERSGGSLEASSISLTELMASPKPTADLLVYPSRYLGEFSERAWLRPLRDSVLKSESFNYADIYPLIRQSLMSYGGKVMAAPLGIELAVVPGDRPRWVELLARAAPYAVVRDRVDILFQLDTMHPRIAGPPFVRALDEMRRDNKSGQGPQNFAARDVYDPSTNSWNTQNNERMVPLVGIGDRLVSVTTTSRNAATAFQLLAWLAGPEISTQLARAGSGTLPVRQSLVASPLWYDPRLSASQRSNLIDAVQDSLRSDEFLVVPRIPGIDEYLSALDEAAKAVVDGSADADTALKQAASSWEQITDKRGRPAQQSAYVKHLGIEN